MDATASSHFYSHNMCQVILGEHKFLRPRGAHKCRRRNKSTSQGQYKPSKLAGFPQEDFPHSVSIAEEFRTLVCDTVWCLVRVGFVHVEVPPNVIEHGVAFRDYPRVFTFSSMSRAISAINDIGDNDGC